MVERGIGIILFVVCVGTGLLLSSVMGKKARLEAQLQSANESISILQKKNESLTSALELRELDLKVVREESNALRRQISDLAKRDEAVKEWGSERLPDSLLDQLVCLPVTGSVHACIR